MVALQTNLSLMPSATHTDKATMQLSKNKIYILILTLIVLIMFIEKSAYLLRCDFTEGVVLKRTSKQTSGIFGGIYTFQVVTFTANNKAIQFNTGKYANYRIGQKVPVVYLKSDATKAKIFNFSEYWLPGFTRGLFVFIILSGIVYAFMRKNEFIEINCKKPFRVRRSTTALRKGGVC